MTDLIQRARDRPDAVQFSALYKEFAPRVKTYLRRHGAGPVSAEELARECLLTAWKMEVDSRGASSCAQQYIFMVARNLRLNGIGKDFVWQALTSTDADTDRIEHMPGTPSDAPLMMGRRIASRTRYLAIKRAVAELPHDQRAVLRLSYLDAVPLAEIARRRGKSLDAIKSSIEKAYRSIQPKHPAPGESDQSPARGPHTSEAGKPTDGQAACTPHGAARGKSKLKHHPALASVMSYASGGLPEPLCAVIATHLDLCADCRLDLALLETIGGVLLGGLEPTEMKDPVPALALRAMEAEIINGAGTSVLARKADVPLPLAQFIGKSLGAITWSQARRGVSQKKIPLVDRERERLVLLKLAPGCSLRDLGPGGWEYCVVLQGFAHTDSGAYGRGDVIEFDTEPVPKTHADEFEGCICLLAREQPRLRAGNLMQTLRRCWRTSFIGRRS